MEYKAKYFVGENLEGCTAAAEAYFGVPRDQLFCEPMNLAESLQGIPLQTLVFRIAPGIVGKESIENMDGHYSLLYEDTGVYLELYANRGTGARLKRDPLMAYISRKRIEDLDFKLLQAALRLGSRRWQIAPAQEEKVLDEEIKVTIAGKELEAYINFLRADPGGQPITAEGIIESLKKAGVIHGINAEAVQHALNDHSYEDTYRIANATLPEHGENGRLVFHFETEKTRKPQVDEEGRVDYRALNLFENVSEGQVLVTRIPATVGRPGITVKGSQIAATPGKEVVLPRGKNILYDEEHLTCFAAIHGMVEYHNGRLNITDVYTVRGNVDMNIGNINFDGSVIISGNVIPGIKIMCSGNIEVGGVVESAELTAGGDIVLKRGIQGMDKGKVTASGDITAGYIERATIVAGGNIMANIIAHSNIEAGDTLILDGKIGSIVGGFARVANEVKAQVIGSVTDTTTEIEVGVLPHKRARMQMLTEERKKYESEVEKLKTIASYLDKLPANDPKRVDMEEPVLASIGHNTQLLRDYDEELARLQKEFEQAAHGRVHAKSSVYSNVKITIASATYKVNQPTQHCTFKLIDGEVAFTSYEA